MALINVTQQNTFEEWRVKTNDISNLVGDGATLTTTATNLVGAVNELRSGVIQGTLSVVNSQFRVQVDAGDPVELILDTSGNLTITGNLIANVTGNADTATRLLNTRTISITGDATWSTSFNGTADVTSGLTLANTGVTAGTYTKLTVDAKGRVTAGTALSSSDVTTALGYTPLNQSNPSVVGNVSLQAGARISWPNDQFGGGGDTCYIDTYSAGGEAQRLRLFLDNDEADIIELNAAGGVTVPRGVISGLATSARYADLAEKYTTDKEYAVGTVMVVALGGDAECTQSFAPAQVAIGVISEKPAFLMNKDAEGQAIALKGRVPVRVIGPIVKGQSLIATADGRAIYGSVNVLGVALETNLDPSEKLVECVIL